MQYAARNQSELNLMLLRVLEKKGLNTSLFVKMSLCKTHTLREAIFIAFAAYYCFNLAYPAEAKHIFSFFQDYYIGTAR
ncbi:MAG: hypothetical protein A6F71_07520 [Cycloclasticus sp. symbiont of Poecilosclerida sp. M]|nr:MAG: hypothetical protein A6F71_07520 [Cycloclasticus sp. symbiont of Poecilosclerida sp. M]